MGREEGRTGRREDPAAFLAFVDTILPRSYAQRFQDAWFLWETSGRRCGWFCEFGGLNGRDFSNTYILERLGWDGVVAEPHPSYAEQMRANRTCFTSTKCVYPVTGETVAFRMVKGRPALSAVGSMTLDDDKRALREQYVEAPVETVSLVDLLTEAGAPPRIDALSIDTEGSEVPILTAFDQDRFGIDLICVEHNDVSREALHELLTGRGYRRKFEAISGHDDWYVHESADRRADSGEWTPPSPEAVLAGLSDVPPFERLLFERRALLDRLTG